MGYLFDVEGEEEMTPPNLSPEQQSQLRAFGICYLIWTVVSIYAYYYLLPKEWGWLAYGPIAFILIAFTLTGIAIISRQMLPKPIDCVYVNHKRVTCCQFCPMAQTKDNIVNNSFPVTTCMEMAKVCYQPMKIPRWCPYAKR